MREEHRPADDEYITYCQMACQYVSYFYMLKVLAVEKRAGLPSILELDVLPDDPAEHSNGVVALGVHNIVVVGGFGRVGLQSDRAGFFLARDPYGHFRKSFSLTLYNVEVTRTNLAIERFKHSELAVLNKAVHAIIGNANCLSAFGNS